MPKSWVPFNPDKGVVSSAYSASAPLLRLAISRCQSVQDVEEAFLMWARDNEQAVSLAITQAHSLDPLSQPLPSLPKMARGRCQARHRTWRRVPQAVRCARDGDYNPPEEAASIQARRLVKQVRRLQTFVSGRTKYETAPTLVLRQQLQQEWQAICRAKWLLRVAHFEVFWWDLPPLEWTRDVLTYVRLDCDAVLRKAAKYRAQLAQFSSRWDAKYGGHRKAFASIKEPPHPPFSDLPVREIRQLVLVQPVDGRKAWYETNLTQFLRHHCLANTDIGHVQILSDHP